MKKLFLIFIVNCSLLILSTRDCFSQWVQQTSGTTSPLYDCDFINQNTGWVCGDNGIILKTTNSGINWIQQNSGINKPLYGIDAVDANIVYCVGWFQTILKSTNGGENWIIIRDGPTGIGSSFFKTFFLNANTGWLLRTGGGYVLRTTNGCLSFDSTHTNNSFMHDIFFKNAQTGVLCGNAALIMRSTDGGVTWNQIFLPLLTGAPNLYRLSFLGDYGWTIGEGAENNMGKLVFRTTNFGSSWDSIARVSYPDGVLNYSVFFSSLNIGWAGGTTGYIFKSTNGGYNWMQQVSPSNGFRNDFWFTNDSIGWSIGGGGQIFKTTNGGTYVVVLPVSSNLPQDFKLYQNYPNPFNGESTIEFEIPIADNIILRVYDILGKEIETLAEEKLNPGKYKVSYNNRNISSGIYIYRLISSRINISKTMTLVK